MDISMILTIVGLILTIVFGLLSIDLFKRKRHPGKLSLVKQTVIGLFNNIAKNFDEISIQYKGSSIKENVIYLKASIINDGDIDIDGTRVEKTLILKLNDNLKWIKSIVSKTSPELLCTPEISHDQSELKFNFGLIRKKEFFQFEALIETLKEDLKADDIFENLKITHRIANTQSVKVTTLLNDEQMSKKKKRMKSFIYNIGGQLLIILLLFIIQIFYFKSAPIQYLGRDNIIYAAKATSENQIKLTNIENDEERIISIKEFQTKENYRPFIPNQTLWEKIKDIRIILPMLLLFLAIMVGWEYLELRKSNKLYDILSKYNNDNLS